MKKFLLKLWGNYLETISDKNTFESYRAYYSATVKWFRKHMYCFTPEIIRVNNLDFLLNIDIDGYITESPDIQLETEYERLKNLNPNNKHTVAMLIADNLRKMISIKSETDCPVCDNEMIFCTGDNKIFLSCEVCGYCTAEKI